MLRRNSILLTFRSMMLTFKNHNKRTTFQKLFPIICQVGFWYSKTLIKNEGRQLFIPLKRTSVSAQGVTNE
jgi:hypothetical protein